MTSHFKNALKEFVFEGVLMYDGEVSSPAYKVEPFLRVPLPHAQPGCPSGSLWAPMVEKASSIEDMDVGCRTSVKLKAYA